MSYFFLYTTGLIPGGLLFLVFHPVSLLALSQSSTMVYATVGLPPTFYAPKLASLIMVSFSFSLRFCCLEDVQSSVFQSPFFSQISSEAFSLVFPLHPIGVGY